ncbi:flavin-binding monooxygenase [Streptomyces longispororuber]|uniref:Flavin-binding monooxygenase n=1 Tax=Streptomyces longispororuber TaxID=68230 RepID=A0A919DGN7_9ACTN|nr:NAD(P)/FAD-dependent oxidoreductase [Streptomyces longispororuber]GHE43544.1 flavin-binding monooxygenase [Streptomyces longispororuber]
MDVRLPAANGRQEDGGAPPSERTPPWEEHTVVVVGAGVSGLGAAIRLRQAGILDVVVLERSAHVGGTWHDNRYPGAACDVPGHLYAYSFAPFPAWRSSLPAADEIRSYLRRCATDCGLDEHLRLGSEVQEARWHEAEARWYVRTGERRYRCRFLVTATGLLSEPHVPALPGLATFRGAAFHTARWDGACDVAGKRVALIGTGASAVQCVPHLAERAAALDVYQRTPPWVLPRLERRVPAAESALYRRSPRLRRLARAVAYWTRESWLLCFTGPLHRVVSRGVTALARLHLRCRVPERELRRRLLPSFRLGCKRVLLSNDYYPALRRTHVSLVTDPVAAVTEDSVITRDGRVRPADVIVFATGYAVGRPALARRVVGRAQRRLADAWSEGMEAHHNVMVPGFPNMFVLLGPHSGLGHSSVTLLLEAQLDYVLSCLSHLREHRLAEVEVLPATQQAYSADLRRRMRDTVWQSGGCRSWYQDPRGGHVTALWPGSVRRYRTRTRTFRAEGHRTRAEP